MKPPYIMDDKASIVLFFSSSFLEGYKNNDMAGLLTYPPQGLCLPIRLWRRTVAYG